MSLTATDALLAAVKRIIHPSSSLTRRDLPNIAAIYGLPAIKGKLFLSSNIPARR
jgi:hypothetical protein